MSQKLKQDNHRNEQLKSEQNKGSKIFQSFLTMAIRFQS